MRAVGADLVLVAQRVCVLSERAGGSVEVIGCGEVVGEVTDLRDARGSAPSKCVIAEGLTSDGVPTRGGWDSLLVAARPT